jgi:hypothetical protein
MPTETITPGSGKVIRRTDMEYSRKKEERDTKGDERTICKMVQAKNFGRMEAILKGALVMVVRKVKGW